MELLEYINKVMKNSLDILLVHPNASNKIYQDLSKNLSSIEPPIWAGLIATYLINKGFNVYILDCEAEQITIEQSINKIKLYNPKVMCVVVYGQQPSASTQNMVGASLLMKAASGLDIKRVYVGPHPSAVPIRTIEDDPEVFIASGEAIYTLEEFLKLKDFSYEKLSKIFGLCYKNHITGKIQINPPQRLIQNLNEVLPEVAWNILPLEKYRTANWHSWTNNNKTQPFVSIYTSLGCPFQCTFCMINSPFNNGNNKNNTFRYWDPIHIIKTFDYFADQNITNVKIADEMFVLKPNHFMLLCDLIIKRGYKFNMWAYARIDTIKEIYLEKLKKAGVNWLGLGIESANFVIRQEITKGKFEKINIKNIIEKIKKYDICVTGNFIFGLPNDTIDTMNETLNMALDLPIDYANFYCAMAYPGSQLHRDFSIKSPEVLPEYSGNPGWIGYSQHAFESFNLPTNNLKNWEILKFRDDSFTKFFTNPVYLDRMIKKFGNMFKQEMDKMLSIKLNRKIYK